MKKRIWELDFLRGISCLLMFLYHLYFDMRYLFQFDIAFLSWEPVSIAMLVLGRVSALLFMAVCGICANLSKNCLLSGIKVFSVGLALTAATFTADYFWHTGILIQFGILHLLGISLILCFLLRNRSHAVLFITALGILVAGLFVNQITVPVSFLFPFGLLRPGFFSADYYPLIPYSAYVLLGFAFGRTLYQKRESRFRFSLSDNPVSFAGRHSLLFYFLHQIVLFALLSAATWMIEIAF